LAAKPQAAPELIGGFFLMRTPRFLAVAACCLLPAACHSADDRFAAIRPTVEAAIQHGDLPGAVVAVLHDSKTV
jgi:hypothetical protein